MPNRLFAHFDSLSRVAAEYLLRELSQGDTFIISPEAAELRENFLQYLQSKKAASRFREALSRLEDNPAGQFMLARRWLRAYAEAFSGSSNDEPLAEVAVSFILEGNARLRQADARNSAALESMRGRHSTIEEGRYTLHYHDFLEKMERYTLQTAPCFLALQQRKRSLVGDYRWALRLEEFRPRVMSQFVRNQLISEVYLPLIGDNLARQIGAAGEQERAGRSGLLLLLSPPGYGKTTLMEYIANRLGLIFVKANGPAIGHQAASLDPAQAPSRTAARELERINFAFEMGDNVMLYLDDIQHCSPEFLQQFISLCDAQRKVEGIWKGQAKTYDFRGKRFCVAMAGNPYTESGGQFRIPDMLANRADIYNLGDIIGSNGKAFRLSYLENALMANPTLAGLARTHMKDAYTLIKAADNGQQDGLQLEGQHSPEALADYLAVVRMLTRIREVALLANRAYIHAATIAEGYRTEPPFLLQGSYRNMNKMAEKVSPIMNEAELEQVILTHYEGEAQALSSGAESNMLKMKEILGILRPEEKARWEEIKDTFRKQQARLAGSDNGTDKALAVQAERAANGLEGIEKVLKSRAGAGKNGKK